MPITIKFCNNRAPPVTFENFEWNVTELYNFDNKTKELIVKCYPLDTNPEWELEVELKIQNPNVGTNWRETITRKFTKLDNQVVLASSYDVSWHGTAIEIGIKKQQCFPTELEDWRDSFREIIPNISDAELIIDDKTMFVCKKILAQSSEYFYELFYKTNFGQNAFHIVDVKYEDFERFLAFLYNKHMTVSPETFKTLAELSKRFKAGYCLEKCEKILIKFEQMSDHEKLELAQGYGFNILHDYILKKLKTTEEVLNLQNKSSKSNFENETNLKMFERINEIHQKQYYCCKIVDFASEKYIQLDAIPFKISRTQVKGWSHNEISIRCDYQDSCNPWQCELIITPQNMSFADAMSMSNKDWMSYNVKRLCFNYFNPVQSIRDVNSTMKVYVTYFVGIFPERTIDFTTPRENLTDVVLSVFDKEFHVSKQILVEKSSYFNTMFYSEFTEKNKNVVELKNVDPHEFEELLQHIYFPDRNINDKNIIGLLKLSQMFDIQHILKKCEKILIFENTLNDAMKIYLSETYHFPDLFKSLVSNIKTFEDLQKLSRLDGFKRLSKDTVADITFSLLDAGN